MNRLSLQDHARILSCLVEGNSMRATTRMCGVSINSQGQLPGITADRQQLAAQRLSRDRSNPAYILSS